VPVVYRSTCLALLATAACGPLETNGEAPSPAPVDASVAISASDAGVHGDAAVQPDSGGVVSGDALAAEDAPVFPPIDSGPGLRVIPPAVLARKAVAYSGYRAGESPETDTYPTEAEITQDLNLLVRGGFTFLRLFDCSPHAATVLEVIKENALDIKVASGIWIAGGRAGFDAANQAQIAQCLALYATYGDIVATVSVGNETLDSWSSVLTSPADLVYYIDYVRARVTQPVTTDDMYLPFTLGNDGSTSYADVLQVAQAVDYLSLHVYAFVDAAYDSWDWEQLAVPSGPARATAMMGAAMDYTKSSLDSVRTALGVYGLSLPIVVGEAGWKSVPGQGPDADPTEVYRAHPVNQSIFYGALEDWVYGSQRDTSSPAAVFYFEAFDEPWKGSDDGWGLFDATREAKYVMWDAFPDLVPPGSPAYSLGDAVYYDPADGGSLGGSN
jgi:exo-beta-1,3-glucanase (GH17 family)